MQLLAFLQATQPKAVEMLKLAAEGIKRTQFLHRIQGEIAKRGVIDVLGRASATARRTWTLYKLLPTPGNVSAVEKLWQEHFQRYPAIALQQ